MKKIFTIMAAMVFTVVAANAQTFTHKFTITLNSPAANSTIANGSDINQAFVINLVQGNIVAGDTIAYVDPFVPQGQVWVRSGFTKNQGDTIQINRTYSSISATPAANTNYCIRAFLFDAGGVKAGFDTVGGRTCNSVTITGFPAGVENMFLNDETKSQKLNIYPNPAIGNTINLDYVAQNASAVEVNIFDLAGRKVMSQSFGKAFKGQEGYNLDIANLNNGMYIMELRQDGVKATGQFIK